VCVCVCVCVHVCVNIQTIAHTPPDAKLSLRGWSCPRGLHSWEVAQEQLAAWYGDEAWRHKAAFLLARFSGKSAHGKEGRLNAVSVVAAAEKEVTVVGGKLMLVFLFVRLCLFLIECGIHADLCVCVCDLQHHRAVSQWENQRYVPIKGWSSPWSLGSVGDRKRWSDVDGATLVDPASTPVPQGFSGGWLNIIFCLLVEYSDILEDTHADDRKKNTCE
jgi:hypothetical protein